VNRRSLRIQQFAKEHPEARVWLRIGVPPRAARALVKAGIRTLEQVGKMSKEGFLAHWGISLATLRLCEKALGKTLPSVVEYWKTAGLPKKAIAIFVREEIRGIEELKAMTRSDALALRGLDPILLRRIEKALGFRFHSPISYWLDKGVPRRTAEKLVDEGILTTQDLAALESSVGVRLFSILEYRLLGIVLEREGSGASA